MLICMACGLSLATQSDMRRACQVFRMEELAEKLGFEFTLDLLGDDQVAGATRSANVGRSVKSAAAVLKDHARSYMKQARKDGLTLLQRLGTDAHFAYNCAVQDLTPRCMHWVSVLGNLVLPSIKRTREEIRTGRVRQYKARICIVAWDTNIPNQQIVVDEQVLVWYRNRFYRANQFCAIYAQFDPRERFPCLSTADEPFASEAITSHQVYLDFVEYVANQIQTTTGATSTQGGSRAIPKARQPDPNYNRSTRPGYGSHQGSTHGYSQQEWNDYYNQWSDYEWEEWRRRNQGRQYRDDRRGYHR